MSASTPRCGCSAGCTGVRRTSSWSSALVHDLPAVPPEAAAGSVEPRHVVVPLRRVLRRARVITGTVTRIEHANRRVWVTPHDGAQHAVRQARQLADNLVATRPAAAVPARLRRVRGEPRPAPRGRAGIRREVRRLARVVRAPRLPPQPGADAQSEAAHPHRLDVGRVLPARDRLARLAGTSASGVRAMGADAKPTTA
jgi:hypothetical protein